MIRRVEDGWPNEARPPSREPGHGVGRAEPGPGARRLGAALVAAGVATGALVAGVTLERIVSGARGSRVEVLRAAAIPPARAVARFLQPIEAEPVEGWVEALAAPELQGRDAPSPGLDRAQRIVAGRLRDLGLRPAPDQARAWAALGAGDGAGARAGDDPELRRYLRPFVAEFAEQGARPFEAPDAAACGLSGPGVPELSLGVDFVPLALSSPEQPLYRGAVRAPLIFAGYGIDSAARGYDDFAALDVRGRVAVVLAGEPFGADPPAGDGVTAEASIWNKIDALAREGAAAALVVRDPLAAGPLVYRATPARWNPPTADMERRGIPALEVTERAASALLAADVGALREEIAATGRPRGLEPDPPRWATVAAATRRVPAVLRNVVAWLPGSDPVAEGYLVVGAHLDHIGVGPRGRVGRGADDNASGVAALLATAAALASEPPRIPVLFVAFSGEEDGLLGAHALVADPPVAIDRCRGMVNLDMVGGGAPDALAAFGLDVSPSIAAAVEAALATGATGVDEVRRVVNRAFFTRSDHYAFHRAGVETLFLFEAWPHLSRDYHTWRDVPETIDFVKVRSAARLSALVVRELARAGAP
ncbi:MAG: M20/M25/M40 family metallo-hydrolase [Planctomycetota bacterium]